VDASARWSELMGLPEDAVPLDEAALLISAHANPELDVRSQLRRLDHLATQVDRGDSGGLCRVLFEQLGLRGDRQHYDDPANSYLDQVLDRRRGIPISLSVLLIEVGRRCGVPLEAVGMPGHFLVRDPSTPDHLIDAFDQGRRLSKADCERLLQAVTGGAGQLTSEMLASAGAWATLARMLANLDRSFERRGDTDALAWVSDLRMRIPNAALGDRRQLAGRLAALGRLVAAAEVLEEAARLAPGLPVRDRLLSEATTLRARLN
jgi:regulator of sirC expression with transglutaminase-like and TPR domain